jgi:tetratricopeptide (TPR) repeat protein
LTILVQQLSSTSKIYFTLYYFLLFPHWFGQKLNKFSSKIFGSVQASFLTMDLYGQTNPRQYDPTLILHAAEEKRSLGDLAGAQLLFESALLEWGDDAREKKRDVDQNLYDAITTLWLAYADFHRANKAWKSAMDAYEQAIQDPVAGKFGRVYLEYARFAEERDKLVTAQNVYIRALIGEDGQPSVTDEQDTTLLWNEFLEMMRKTTPTLNLTSLKDAVYKDHNQKRSQPELVSSINDNPEIKKSKYGEESSNTHVVTADDVESEYQSLLGLISQMPPEISAAWMARDGDAPPQAPEPPLFSPTRPKMSDPSGKDLIGSDMALQVTERLLCKSGTVMLETCRALWLMTALLEKEFTQTLDSLDKSMVR